jgi:hypothetical protein
LSVNKDVSAALKASTDERFQLLERIVSTPPFQKSQRFRDLLRYLVEKSIHGEHGDLSETKIGVQVFHRSPGYSPVEDSTVRVHIRQLRTKLYEYFDDEGRNETLILEIPKGGFLPVFRPANQRRYGSFTTEAFKLTAKNLRRNILVWTLSAISVLLAIGCFIFAYQSHLKAVALLHLKTVAQTNPEPIDTIFSKVQYTTVVVGDVNYGINEMLAGREGTLQEYLDTNVQASSAHTQVGSENMERLMHYIKTSSLTSYADAVVVADLAALANERGSRVQVRLARELHLRDF